MSMPVARRGFLKQASGICGMAVAGNWAIAAPEEAANWCIPMLGDLHFDRLAHHDLAWLAREHPHDVRQVENYSQITRERTPQLLANMRAACRQLMEAGASVPFQGDCTITYFPSRTFSR